MSKLKKGNRVICGTCGHCWRPRQGGLVRRPGREPRIQRCPQCGKRL